MKYRNHIIQGIKDGGIAQEVQKLGKEVTQWSISHGPSDATGMGVCVGSMATCSTVKHPICISSIPKPTCYLVERY